MTNLFKKIATSIVGMAMAIGVGVAIGKRVVSANALSESWNLASASHSSASATSVTWISSYLDMVLTKESSSTSANNYLGGTNAHTRMYASQKLTFTPAANIDVSSVAITTTGSSYNVGFTDSTSKINCAVSASGTTVTITPTDGTDVFSVLIKSATRVTNVSYNYTSTQTFGTLHHIKIATPATKTEYDVGDSFSSSGIAITAFDGENEATSASKDVTASVTFTGYNLSSAGNQTVTVSYTEGGVTKTVTYSIKVNAAPNYVYSYSSNSFFDSTSYSTTETKSVTVDGITFEHLGGYKYNSQYMSLRNVSGMYVGNTTAYNKYLLRVVVVTNADVSSALKLYEGPVALSEATVVTPTKSADGKTLTYDLSDSNQFFKLKNTASTYINFVSVKVYLGSTPVAKVVDTVSIATPGSVFVGKTLQLTATVTYLNDVASDHNVTWRVSSGSGATVSDDGLVTAVAATATTIEAKSVEKNSSDVQVATTVTITPLPNRITAVVWDTSNAKKSYNVGDSLDISNITAVGTNESGDDDVELTLTESNFSGFDSSAAANSQTITISYPNEINPSSPFTTTYSIKIVATPDVEILPSDFATGSYGANDGEQTFDGVTFDVLDTYQNSGGIQVKATSGQFHNTSPLGLGVTGLSIKVKTNSALVYLGNSALTTNNGEQAETVAAGDEVSVELDSDSYQYIRIVGANGKYCVIDYVKVWYAPFVPTITLDETSFVFTQGDAGELEVNATANHFTNNNSVSYSVASSDQSVLDDGDINEDDGYILISKADVNPGTTTVTVTGTYLSEEATATFTITCNAVSRNLLSIAITTASSDVEFEAGAKFSISNLVVTGTFDAAPTTADVTSECLFKLWNGASETAVTPGSSTLSAGSYTVRVSHPESEAGETLTYSINVVSASTLTITQSVIGEAFAYADTNESSLEISLNAQLNSTVDLESYGLYKNGTNIQMNSGKGTYIKNTIAVPGKILRIEMDWASGTDKNCPTIYFGSSFYATKPSVGGVQATVGANNSVLSNGNYSYFYLDGTTVTGSCQMSELRIVYIANDEGQARNFADKYLLMNSYDQGGSQGSANGNNTCLTQYDTVKTAYGKLTANQKTEFAKLTNPVKRLQDWAKANNETFDESAGTFTQKSRSVLTSIANKNGASSIIIVVISMLTITALGGFFFIRKRKEER